MSDFAPPSGPPPPKVPEGWKAIWNDQYKEWFFVNIYTKQSQWDKPETPAFDPNSSYAAPSNDAPPEYGQGGHNAPIGAGVDSKSSNLNSNNPYSQNVAESDEAMAKRLQEEEDRRISADKARGANNSYYSSGSNQGYPNAPDYNSQQSQQQVPVGGSSSASSGSRGFLSKIKEKMQNPPHRPMGAPMMGYNAGGYPPQQYGGYPQQGYGRPMGGMPMGMGGGMMGGGYGQPVKRKGGLGMGGAAALGVGGGLVGGMLLADGMNDMQDQGYDSDGGGGGDMDGGDMGGGDF